MNVTIDEGEREAVVLIDKAIYADEAVKLAAQVFSARADFFVEEDGKERTSIVIRLGTGGSVPELRRIAGEFLNEALNQDLRLQLVRSNSRVLQLMTAQALAAAKGPPPGPVEPDIEKGLREEAERIIAEERAAS